jgi:anti-sigma factor RsiW
MNCAEINLLLHAYVDGELDVVRSLEVEQHVKSCAACAKKMDSLKVLQSTFKESDLVYRAPVSLRRSVRQIARPPEDREARLPRDLQWFWKWLAIGATTAAILAIVLRPMGMSPNGEIAGEVVGAHIRSLMAEHLTDVVSSDQHTVKPWFAGKLDFSPAVIDFADQGFTLVGGRLDYLNGRTVAALIYKHNKHFINAFIWPATNTNVSEQESYHGYNIVSFTTNGFQYWLVSDMDEPGLAQLAALLGQGK